MARVFDPGGGGETELKLLGEHVYTNDDCVCVCVCVRAGGLSGVE